MKAVAAKRILIVEDEPNLRLVYRAALCSEEYLISVAEDGEMARRWLLKEPTDLVVLDLVLPGIGGMALLNEIRRAGITIPVIIVSAQDDLARVVEAMRQGADDFLPKPTTPDALRRAVEKALSGGDRGRHGDRR